MNLTVNGMARSFDGDPEMPLLWYLRDELGLTGAKFGCGAGLCGACVVHIDGVASFSCVTPMTVADGSQVVTIEGLSLGGKLHPLQQALVEHGGTQCGFCTPGIVLSAKALLDNNACPSAQDVRHAIAGNICRCTGYDKIVDAVMAAAATLQARER